MLLEEGLPESLKLTSGWHCPSIPRCPCGGDVDPEERKRRFPVRAGAEAPLERVTDELGAFGCLGELDADPGSILEMGWAVEH